MSKGYKKVVLMLRDQGTDVIAKGESNGNIIQAAFFKNREIMI